MNLTTGVMLACGATGAVLAVMAVAGLSSDFQGVGSTRPETFQSPMAVTLPPIPVRISGMPAGTRLSLRLTVPGAGEKKLICERLSILRSVAARLLNERLGNAPSGGALPVNIDLSMRSHIAGVVGDRMIERVEVTIIPLGAEAPASNCGGLASGG